MRNYSTSHPMRLIIEKEKMLQFESRKFLNKMINFSYKWDSFCCQGTTIGPSESMVSMSTRRSL